MPKYTLTYFNARGRAEPIRMIFKLAGVQFEDIRLPFPLDDVWAEAKKDGSKYPFGQVPVLDVDGTVLSHSMSILKYLAREFGFAPRDNLQQAQADAIVDQIQDITNKYGWFYFAEQDPAKKEAQKKKWLEKTVPDTLAGLERILNSSGTGYFVTDKITYAEIAFFTTINNCAAGGKTEIPPQLADFPKTRALYEKIMNEPIIARYMKDRPAGDV